MKTLKEIETYDCFYLGTDEKFAAALCDSLAGDEDVLPDSVITIDLVKRKRA